MLPAAWQGIGIIAVLAGFVLLISRRANQQRDRPRITPSSVRLPDPTPPNPGAANIVMSVIFMVLAMITILGGWWRMYSYDVYSDKIVGGDAYNYAILATRGTGIITAGVGFAVIAVVFALLAIAERVKAQ